jgi:hypothetical protein
VGSGWITINVASGRRDKTARPADRRCTGDFLRVPNKSNAFDSVSESSQSMPGILCCRRGRVPEIR